MKKFRFLVALALMVAVLSSFAMAATTDIVTLEGIDGTNIPYTSGDLTLKFVTTEAYASDCPSATLYYDSTKWTPTSITTDVTGASTTLLNTSPAGEPCSDIGVQNTYGFAKGANVITVTYTPVTGADVIGSTFRIKTYWQDENWENECETDRTYTVTAAQTATTTTVNAASEGYTNVQGKSGDNIFGVWVGTYNVSAGDATKTITKAVVNFAAANKNFTADNLSISGKGTVTFKVAIVGVPEQYATGSTATLTIQ